MRVVSDLEVPVVSEESMRLGGLVLGTRTDKTGLEYACPNYLERLKLSVLPIETTTTKPSKNKAVHHMTGGQGDPLHFSFSKRSALQAAIWAPMGLVNTRVREWDPTPQVWLQSVQGLQSVTWTTTT